MSWEPEVVAKYTEAGNMLRHFSSVRSVVISFTLSLFFVIVGIVVSNIETGIFIVPLLITELFVFVWALILYLYLSVSRDVARRCLVAIENEQVAHTHRTLELFKLTRDLKLDFYDRMYLILTAGLHLFLYAFLLIYYLR